MINYWQIYSRILVNVLVKTNQIRFRGGAMGGPTPSTRASPRLHCRPRGTQCGLYERENLVGSMETHETYGDLWRPRREINGYPFTTFGILSRLSWENSILDYQSCISKFTSTFTNITSKFANNHRIDCM